MARDKDPQNAAELVARVETEKLIEKTLAVVEKTLQTRSTQQGQLFFPNGIELVKFTFAISLEMPPKVTVDFTIAGEKGVKGSLQGMSGSTGAIAGGEPAQIPAG